MTDSVVQEWIATGIPCSTLNKQLQQARTGSPDDKQRMGAFVKAMGSRFKEMEGLFGLEWPAGEGEGVTVLSYRPTQEYDPSYYDAGWTCDDWIGYSCRTGAAGVNTALLVR